QDIHRRFAGGGHEMDGDAPHYPDQQRGEHDALKTPEAADHHYYEGYRDDLGAHGRMHDGDGGEERAPHRGQRHAEHDDGGHIGLQPYAERRDHVGPLDAGAHHAAERRLVEEQPDADHDDGDHGEQQQTVAREQEVADDDRALEITRQRRAQRRGAPDDADQ